MTPWASRNFAPNPVRQYFRQWCHLAQVLSPLDLESHECSDVKRTNQAAQDGCLV